MIKKIIVGTRSSKLALIQTQLVERAIKRILPDVSTEIKPFSTLGDRLSSVPLDVLSGRGVFVNDIEQALLNGEIDIAVHSAKDMQPVCPKGLKIGAYLKREDPRDVLLSRDGISLEDMKEGQIIGVGGIRRRLQIKELNRKVEIRYIRGNVDTRIDKMEKGDFDAIVLAAAGVLRMGLKEKITQYFSLDECIPAVAQGAIAVQIRCEQNWEKLIEKINDFETQICVETERIFLKEMNGNCRIPVSANCIIKNGIVRIKGWMAGENGKIIRGYNEGAVEEHNSIGRKLAKEMKKRLLSR